MSNIARLLKIASDPLVRPTLTQPGWEHSPGNREFTSLANVLAQKDGFFAFEGALLFYPRSAAGAVAGLTEWNSLTGWRRCYSDVVPGNMLFFAEDVFANQFGLRSEEVFRFNPETGEVSHHSTSLEEWAGRILQAYDYETGWSLAKEWQERHGPLAPGKRLVPIKPFVLGGEYEVVNLRAVDGVKAMELFGTLFQQIRGLADGTQVTVTGWLDP